MDAATPAPSRPGTKLHVNYIDDLPEPAVSEPMEAGVKVFYRENDLRDRVKAAGGR